MITHPESRWSEDKSDAASNHRLEKLARAANLLKNAGDPTRVRIILLLAKAETHVDRLIHELGKSPPAVSYHLARLRVAGLAVTRREGQRIWYSLTKSGEELAEAVNACTG